MTVDGLTTPPPLGDVALCIVCHETTTAPVRVQYIESTSGPGTTLWACPEDAPSVTPGPMPGELY
ncbi:hypothetical protein OG594_33495 [Streptomyces sp. NBC_01214]|uniref:hypothetical protein n=1 Tax=Streptomyces sp. NBC_01214 TaxID=2903777 RepID=UPI0022518C32|nr:hypothetical protein [Streptomyces sp. NBC_01214]MCX4806480.1 hypothetical protein [Streptomyces sp. NBC_01214]